MDGTTIIKPAFNAKSTLYDVLQQKLDMPLLDQGLLPFVGDWKTIEGRSAAVLLAKITVSLSRGGNNTPWPLMHSVLALRGISISFYARKAIYVDAIVRDIIGNIGHAGFFVFPDQVYSLTNTAQCLHMVNATEGFVIETPKQALAYLKLYCWIICADDGPFQIIENKNQIMRVFDNVNVKKLAPLQVKKKKEEWALCANVLYGSSFFRAAFLLDEMGTIEMEDEEEIKLEKHDRKRNSGFKGEWQVGDTVKYFYERGAVK